ncbi:hypothetical protein H0G86_007381 [Trichoderma simmonsii]|uniref:Uncharacterized protein n=1 Tax=Trichoderma simmonsii TaxID=1491479 RepID=A0A8G0PGA3_9HYPO|nr:hypothetical protein H0G86_007381 [Trichoderma simmonsii]
MVESAISLAARLREAQQRQQGLAGVLDHHGQVLVETQRIVTLVKEEEALQTAAVAAELVTLDMVVKGVVDVLTRIQTNGQGKRSGRVPQIFYQLTHGSRDEADLRGVMENLGRAKGDLGLCISVAHVGLSRGMQDTLVLNTRLLERVDSAVRAVVGNDQGLVIGKLARGRPVQENGTLVVTADDLASIERHRGNASSHLPAASGDGHVARHIVAHNMTADQAFQINGPVGMQEWYAASHIVQENKAIGKSTQINAGMSMEAFSQLLQAHQR